MTVCPSDRRIKWNNYHADFPWLLSLAEEWAKGDPIQYRGGSVWHRKVNGTCHTKLIMNESVKSNGAAVDLATLNWNAAIFVTLSCRCLNSSLLLFHNRLCHIDYTIFCCERFTAFNSFCWTVFHKQKTKLKQTYQQTVLAKKNEQTEEPSFPACCHDFVRLTHSLLRRVVLTSAPLSQKPAEKESLENLPWSN